MLDELTSSEVADWYAFAEIEPWGTGVDDFRTGTLAAVIANVNRNPERAPYSPGDFMPTWDPVERAARAEAAEEANAAAFAAALIASAVPDPDAPAPTLTADQVAELARLDDAELGAAIADLDAAEDGMRATHERAQSRRRAALEGGR